MSTYHDRRKFHIVRRNSYNHSQTLCGLLVTQCQALGIVTDLAMEHCRREAPAEITCASCRRYYRIGAR
jgi:hypothetical protein